jgi:hypothetical protein
LTVLFERFRRKIAFVLKLEVVALLVLGHHQQQGGEFQKTLRKKYLRLQIVTLIAASFSLAPQNSSAGEPVAESRLR